MWALSAQALLITTNYWYLEYMIVDKMVYFLALLNKVVHHTLEFLLKGCSLYSRMDTVWNVP